jgi:hypothetical protein
MKASPFNPPAVARKASPFDPPAQLDFLPDLTAKDNLPSEKQSYRADEVAAFLHCSLTQVEALGQSGALERFAINDKLDPPPLRIHHRYTGRGILHFINIRRRNAG